MLRLSFVCLLTALHVCAGCTQENKLMIVTQGADPAPIVIAGDAPPMTRDAATELADYIEKITGARPAVLEGAPDPTPDRAIWVGYQPALDALFPANDFDFQHPEEILIKSDGNHLVIAGRDRWDADALVVEGSGHRRTVDGRQWEYGTANAVYAFLRDYLDIVWLWPGELGEDIVPRETISFEPFTYRYHPQIRQRATVFRLSALGDTRGHSHQWTRRQGLQLDSLLTPGGHDFVNWWDRYHEQHPDIFALQPDGTRSGFPRPKQAKLCQSNPKVWDLWLQGVIEQLEEHPHRTVFNAAPNDSAYNGICVCDNCRAWDRHGPEKYPHYQWKGGRPAGDDVLDAAMSDRHITFTNHLVRKLKERFPDRDDYRVLQFAYHNSTWAPQEAVPDERIIISYIGNFPLTDAEDRDYQKKKMTSWKGVAPAIVYRPNQWVYGGFLGLPQVAPHRLIEDMKFLAEHQCVGIFVDSTWEHWATTGPHYYLMGRLAWDPYQDGEALLAKYYDRGFGKAADDIRGYWELMADEFGDLPYRERLGAIVKERFGPDRRAEARQCLERAAQAVADEPQKYRDRVAYVRAGYDFNEIMFEMIAFIDNTQDVESPENQDKLKAYWQRIRAISDAYPHALNYRWLPNRMARRGRFVPEGMD